MNFITKNVQLACVDHKNDTFRITTRTDIKDLAASIQRTGLINPPILKVNGSSFIIVSGFRRISAYQFLGMPNIMARIIEPPVIDFECFKLAIAENSSQRPLNLVEQSRSVNMLSSYYEDDISVARETSSLGLPDTPCYLRKIKKICHLPDYIQQCIIDNTISLSMALEFMKLSTDEGMEFARLFKCLNLSLNKQREIMMLVKEITKIEEISIVKVLQAENFRNILDNKDLDRVQKTHDIRLYLKKRRFPAIIKTEKEFKKNVKELRLGRCINLIPPKNFEGTVYTLSLSFKNLRELNNCIENLNVIAKKPTLKKILD